MARIAHPTSAFVFVIREVEMRMWRHFSVLVFSVYVQAMCSAAEPTILTVHRECSDSETKSIESDKLFLRFLSKEAAGRNSEPVCVLGKPELSGFPVLSARVEPSTQGIGALIAIDLGEGARSAIEKMTRDNKWKSMAVVVNARIVSLATITQAYSDTRILISVPTKADAEIIAVAVSTSRLQKR